MTQTTKMAADPPLSVILGMLPKDGRKRVGCQAPYWARLSA